MSWEIALPGWALRVIQLLRMRPYPDPRILEIEPAGGGGSYIDFYVHVANNGTQRCRCTFSARVEDVAVECAPPKDDLLANSPATHVRVLVPRPELGDLIEQFGDEPTLYNRTLRFELTFGKKSRSLEWREKVYTPEEDRGRHELQQRRWRQGLGEETEADQRAEWLGERLRRLENSEEDGQDYDFV